MQTQDEFLNSALFNDFLSAFRRLDDVRRNCILPLLYECNTEDLHYVTKTVNMLLDKRNFISAFPDELSMKVFSYLEPRDLCLCAYVSRDWKRLAYDKLLWKHIIDTYFRTQLESQLFPHNVVETDEWKEQYRTMLYSGPLNTELAGEYYSAAISASNTLYVWGQSPTFNLLTNSSRPRVVLSSLNFVLVSVKWHHLAALTDDGKLFTWGEGSHYQLGHGNANNVASPQRVVPMEPNEDMRFKWCSAGVMHTTAISESGDLYTFGDSSDHRLGLSTMQDVPAPQKVEGLSGLMQCSSSHHTLALSTAGEVFACGLNRDGQCGQGHFDISQPIFNQVRGSIRSLPVAQVSAGIAHSGAVTTTGRLYMWGRTSGGRLGLKKDVLLQYANEERLAVPQVVDALKDVVIKCVSCGGGHTMVIAVDGSMYSWGESASGQLGRPVDSQLSQTAYLPRKVDGILNEGCFCVSAGNGHSICVTMTRKIWGMGSGWNYRLGLGDTSFKKRPVRIENIL